MVNSSNDVLLQEKMEQMMNDIYETLRGLFFNHIHEALPPFERFKKPTIELSDKIKTKTWGQYSLEEIIEKIKPVIEPMIDQIHIYGRLKNYRLEKAVRIIERIIRNCECGEFREKSEFEELLNELRYIMLIHIRLL